MGILIVGLGIPIKDLLGIAIGGGGGGTGICVKDC